jgi:hypothetical protein
MSAITQIDDVRITVSDGDRRKGRSGSKREVSVDLDGVPEGADEIEDVLGDDQVAIVALGMEELGAALEELELGKCEMDRDGGQSL